MFTEETFKTERIYEGKVLNLRVDTVELPDKKYSKREIVEHPEAVGILPITKEGKIILVEQFRKPVEKSLLEIPAGKVESKEKPIVCALRELEEETGYTSSEIKKINQFYTTPGFSNEIMHIFLATNLKKGNAKPDDDEYIKKYEFTIGEILEKIKKGELEDSKTLVAILQYREIINNTL